MGSIDKACISGFLCRLCSEMHRIVIHIYGDQGQRLCLVEKINGYLPITISPTDPLPKTICTTCLRRVEQHYDLLMRLSRIREERFVRLEKHRGSFVAVPGVAEISSPEYSEDEDENPRPLTSLQEQVSSSISSIFAEPLPVSSSNANGDNENATTSVRASETSTELASPSLSNHEVVLSVLHD